MVLYINFEIGVFCVPNETCSYTDIVGMCLRFGTGGIFIVGLCNEHTNIYIYIYLQMPTAMASYTSIIVVIYIYIYESVCSAVHGTYMPRDWLICSYVE